MNPKLLLTTAAIFFCIAAGCSHNTDQAAKDQAAKGDAATTQSSTDDMLLPGMKPGTMPAGCYLRANIDGKKWVATEMSPDSSHPSQLPVTGKSGKTSITFVIDGVHVELGKPHNLSDMDHITYWGGGGFFVGAESGQVTITKMDGQFIEGTFNFTAEKDGKKVTCTDGQFRIPAPIPSSSN
jgi:hypothetical protein